MDLMVSADVTYDSKTYSLNSAYKLEGTRFTSSASWSSPKADLSYSMDLSSNNGKMEATAECSWEPSKKV